MKAEVGRYIRRVGDRFVRSRVTSVVIVLIAMAPALSFAQQLPNRLQFNRIFAPQDGMVSPVERPTRDEICLNGSWQFQPVAVPKGFKPNGGDAPKLLLPTVNGWDTVPIRIPSPWNINAFPNGAKDELGLGGDFRCFPSYPQSWESAEMGWLRRRFKLPAGWGGRRLILHFDAVDGAAEVVVNGKAIGEHFDNFLPFEFDVTDAVHADGDNELLVGVRKASLFDQQGGIGRRPYVGGSMWAETVVGIWQDVYLLALPPLHVSDLLVRPLVDTDSFETDVTLTNTTNQEQRVEVSGNVQPWVNLAGSDVLDAPEPKWRLDPSAMDLPAQEVTVPAGGQATVTLREKVNGRLQLWSPDAPNLYGLVLSVKSGGAVTDVKYMRFGWRQLKLLATSLELNGKPILLKGDAWHFLGVPEMTRRYAWAWYQAVKGTNCNAVRLHAQPYPKFFLDVADEQGIFVLDETGIWGSDGSPKFDSPKYWDAADAHVTGLVMRDRNHPSVFGYSVSNEMLIVMRNRHASAAVMDMALGYYTKWVNEIHQIDPTRPWISGDGEEDADGRLPIVIGHYGGVEAPKKWASKGKPWGIGESGMAYYGTPKQVSEFNGPIAYESMQGRMDGVARQAYQLITKSHQSLNAAYSSVFNIVWYGLHPLPIGLADTSRPPTIDDGVWFGPLVEGVPGMQPERLGPYCTTLNPGYDPKLPLLQSWPLFDAIKAANAPGGPVPSEYDHLISTPSPTATPPVNESAAVRLLDGAHDDVKLELMLLGVPLSNNGESDAHSVIIISGQSPPPATAKHDVDQVLAAGGTVLVWRPARSQLEALNALIPMPLEMNARNSTSLVPVGNDPLMSGLTSADFYFADLRPDAILDGGLTGPVIDAGRVVLQAPAVDWRRWNGKAEVVKTGSTARSEAEAQPSGAAFVYTPVGHGRVIVCNLTGLTAIPERVLAARTLLTNIGIKLVPQRDLIGGGIFTNTGVLRRALVLGRFGLDAAARGQGGPGLSTNYPEGKEFQTPMAGQKVADSNWRDLRADPTLTFDLAHGGLSGPTENAVVYISFWINSPRSLDDVLGEPDVPRVDLLVGGSDKLSAAWLNGKPLTDDPKAAGNAGSKSVYSALVLKRGWNHVLLRLTHREGKWEFNSTLRSDNNDFLSQLQAALQPPSL